jgi:multidrug resistance efflux pump
MSKTQGRQSIYADQELVHAVPEYQTATSKSKAATIVEALKLSIRNNKLLLALVGLVFVLSAAWLIRNSVLYERTDDAQVNARIIPLSARITGQVQQVTLVEGQLVHAGDVSAVMDQRDYSIAVYKALANLAYAENIAASLYYDAAITVSSVQGGVISAQAAIRNAQAETAAAARKLLADEAVLEQAQADDMPRPDKAQVESAAAVVASDQEHSRRSTAIRQGSDARERFLATRANLRQR